MWSCCGEMRRRFMLAVLYFPAVVLAAKLHRPFNNSIPAVFVFGDSTVDSGNNNYCPTLLKSNFPPYGVDFPGHVATGRFTDGRLVTDFLASYLGIKENVPPYLDPKLELKDLMTGVSFASGGSGYDHIMSTVLGVIPMKRQIEYFKECKQKIASKIGKKKAQDLVQKAAYVVSAATNDIVFGYYADPLQQNIYDINTYLDILIETAEQFLQDLKKEGAQNVAVAGLLKIGCIPAMLTIVPGGGSAVDERGCNETLSLVAQKFNLKLERVVNSMKSRDFRIFYADIYKPMDEMVKNPTKYGIEKVSVGCCGSAESEEATLVCNPSTPLCKDRSKYVFFDSLHPTQVTYKHMFKVLRPTIDKAIKAFH